jgi:hemerythrin superfamily protein
MAAEPNDVITVLKHDHREVEDLFDKLEATTAGDAQLRRQLADQMMAELVRHSVAEEMYLYPATRKYLPDGDEIADREIADHATVEQIMKQMEKTGTEQPEFSSLLTRLIREVSSHVEDEENNLFPELARHVSVDELNELGRRVQAAKGKAPTRPHPSAPTEPPLNKALAPGLGLVDRVRDYVTGRGKG